MTNRPAPPACYGHIDRCTSVSIVAASLAPVSREKNSAPRRRLDHDPPPPTLPPHEPHDHANAIEHDNASFAFAVPVDARAGRRLGLHMLVRPGVLVHRLTSVKTGQSLNRRNSLFVNWFRPKPDNSDTKTNCALYWVCSRGRLLQKLRPEGTIKRPGGHVLRRLGCPSDSLRSARERATCEPGRRHTIVDAFIEPPHLPGTAFSQRIRRRQW
jgi:hypothetical protein